jgi:hypothetical protein
MAWSLSQEVVTGTGGASATTKVITLGANATSAVTGNLLVIGSVISLRTVTGIATTSANLADGVILQNTDAGGGVMGVNWVVYRITGGLLAADTVTLTLSGTGVPGFIVWEFANDGGAVSSFTADVKTQASGAAATAFSSGTTAATSSTDPLELGIIAFDNGAITTQTITPAVLSPVWNAGTTAKQIVAGTLLSSMRWRTPAASTTTIFNGSISTASDYVAGVANVKAVTGNPPVLGPAFQAIPFSPVIPA